MLVTPDRRQLAAVADLLKRGQVQTVVDTVVPLSRAPDAFAGKVPRRGRGKVVVAIEEAIRTGALQNGTLEE